MVVRDNSSFKATFDYHFNLLALFVFASRYHRSERARRSPGYGDSVPHADSQAYGLQELSGQESGGSGDPRVYQYHLL